MRRSEAAPGYVHIPLACGGSLEAPAGSNHRRVPGPRALVAVTAQAVEMKGVLRALFAMCLVLACGCTSLQWAGMAPDAIREGIHDGDLVRLGDRVGIVDRHGTEHVVRVVMVNQDSIIGQRRGEAVEIAIDDIVALRTARIDRGRTTAVAMGGTAFGSYALVILLIVLACT